MIQKSESATGTAVAPASGQAPRKFKYAFTPPAGAITYTEQHALAVGDVLGHQLRIASSHARYGAEGPAYDGVKVVESFAWLTSDTIDGSGPFTQHTVTHMANGDKIFSRVDGVSHGQPGPEAESKRAFTAVSTITGGTGRFTSLRGTLRSSGVADLRTGFTANPVEGEYWYQD